jgi:hypothetical protein
MEKAKAEGKAEYELAKERGQSDAEAKGLQKEAENMALSLGQGDPKGDPIADVVKDVVSQAQLCKQPLQAASAMACEDPVALAMDRSYLKGLEDPGTQTKKADCIAAESVKAIIPCSAVSPEIIDANLIQQKSAEAAKVAAQKAAESTENPEEIADIALKAKQITAEQMGLAAVASAAAPMKKKALDLVAQCRHEKEEAQAEQETLQAHLKAAVATVDEQHITAAETALTVKSLQAEEKVAAASKELQDYESCPEMLNASNKAKETPPESAEKSAQERAIQNVLAPPVVAAQQLGPAAAEAAAAANESFHSSLSPCDSSNGAPVNQMPKDNIRKAALIAAQKARNDGKCQEEVDKAAGEAAGQIACEYGCDAKTAEENVEEAMAELGSSPTAVMEAAGTASAVVQKSAGCNCKDIMRKGLASATTPEEAQKQATEAAIAQGYSDVSATVAGIAAKKEMACYDPAKAARVNAILAAKEEELSPTPCPGPAAPCLSIA